MLNAVEISAMPVDQSCLLCSELAVFRCQECGPLVYYCFECFSKQQQKVNLFHIAEKWEVMGGIIRFEDTSLITYGATLTSKP